MIQSFRALTRKKRDNLRGVLIILALAAACANGTAAQEEPELTPGLIQLIREKADQGNAEAQAVLGAMYDNGKGVRQEYTEAVKWYRRAAEQGIATAQFNLGMAYKNGQGIPQNYWEAYVWHSLAAANGHKKAAEYREDDANQLSPTDLSSAQNEAARRHTEIQGGTDN